MEREEQKMIDAVYLFIVLGVAAPVLLVVIYIDYLKFKKWMDQREEATPFQHEEPVRISKRQAELFNRSMRRINKELKERI